MPNLRCRGRIALAALAVTLVWSKPASAQHGPPREHGGLFHKVVTGTLFESVDLPKSEHQLHHLESKFGRDVARGRDAAAEHHARRIERVRYRIGVDEWLIRYNSCQQLTPYPNPIRLDPISCEAIGQYRYPSFNP